MTEFAEFVLFAWPFIVLILCAEFKGYRGPIVSFIFGALFLPCLEMQLFELPYSKRTVTGLSVLVATIIFQPKLIFSFRFRWFDIPILVYVLCPIASSLANNLGASHGIRLAFDQTCMWALPYFLGRIHINSFESIRYLAKIMVIGSLCYVPFCLFELRMSPQLHKTVYGFRPGTYSVHRWGGYRPSVFMEQGLTLSLWMTFTSVMGFVLWRCRTPKKIIGLPMSVCVLILLTTTVLCKSTGSLILLFFGLSAVYIVRSYRMLLPVVALALISFVYIGTRSASLNDGSIVVDITRNLISDDRAQSVGFRFKNEELLIGRALESPAFGWGGFGRNQVADDRGKDLTILDGFWIITLGNYGFTGLVSLYLAFSIAPLGAALRFRSKKWHKNDVMPVIGLAVILLLFLIDSLMNAMPTAVYPFALGAVSAIYGLRKSKLESELQLTEEIEDPEIQPRQLWPPRQLNLTA